MFIYGCILLSNGDSYDNSYYAVILGQVICSSSIVTIFLIYKSNETIDLTRYTPLFPEVFHYFVYCITNCYT